MAVAPKMKQGMVMMKYALNHPWHFSSFELAVFCALLQSSMVYFFEAVKIYVLLNSHIVEDVLFRFIVLAIIGNIDDYFYHSISERSGKEFIREFWNEKEVCADDDEEDDDSEIN